MSKAILKNEQEIVLMRESGRLLAQVFKMLDDYICEGMTTLEIDSKVEDYIRNELNARPASKGQYDYKFSLNSSINEVVCHGVPSDTITVNAKDIINPLVKK